MIFNRKKYTEIIRFVFAPEREDSQDYSATIIVLSKCPHSEQEDSKNRLW